MDEYRATGIAQNSGWDSKRGPFGNTLVQRHAWRRGHDRGKRRLTHGVYGTKTQIMKALAKSHRSTVDLIWTKFHNGKFMVW